MMKSGILINKEIELNSLSIVCLQNNVIIDFKNKVVKAMWENNTPKIALEFGDYQIEISLYTGNDKHEFLRSGERVFRQICFKHTDEGIDYWVPMEKALKYHALNVKHKGRYSRTNLNVKDDYFKITKNTEG